MKELRKIIYGKAVYVGILNDATIPNGLCKDENSGKGYLFFIQKTDDFGNQRNFDYMSHSYTCETLTSDNLEVPSIEDYLTMSSILRTNKNRYNKKTHKLIFV